MPLCHAATGDSNSHKVMEQQMEQFFFGEGTKLRAQYVPPEKKS